MISILDAKKGLCYNNKKIQKGPLLRRKRHYMTQDKIKRIHQWYSWILAAVLAVIGVLLIVSCLDIYASGPRSYSAEAIVLRFQRIAIPVCIGVIGISGGIALNLLLPVQEKRSKGSASAEDIMMRLRRKVDIPPVKKEMRLRLVLRMGTAILFAALMVYPLIYFLTPGNFTVSELNTDVVRAIMVALVPAIAGLVLCWVCRMLVHSSFRREAAVYKKALAEGHKLSANGPETTRPCCCRTLGAVRAMIAVIALVFIIIGICNGGAEDVLKKAIAICTECIGLG